MSRPILSQQDIHTDSFEDEEPVGFTICGPNDSNDPRTNFPKENVLIIEWRSPLGDDLKLTLELDRFRKWLT